MTHIAPVGRPGILGVHSMDSFNMSVPDPEEARRFYTDFGLDVRESGQGLALHTLAIPISGAISTRGRASDNHMVAFAKSAAPGLHHCSWHVPFVQAIGLGAMHMADSGFSKGWGLGRHVLGSNNFHYVRDPWGSYSEYSCDIDYIPAEMDWEGQSRPIENSFYLWGSEPPKDFACDHAAAIAPELPAPAGI